MQSTFFCYEMRKCASTKNQRSGVFNNSVQQGYLYVEDVSLVRLDAGMI
jgi:hypothetical protein